MVGRVTAGTRGRGRRRLVRGWLDDAAVSTVIAASLGVALLVADVVAGKGGAVVGRVATDTAGSRGKVGNLFLSIFLLMVASP